MARRHDPLVPLSHDHHHALVQARRLAEASLINDESVRRRATDDLINFYPGSLVRHFGEEEELFLAPLVDHEDAQTLVMRAVTDDLRVHALARGLKRELVDGRAAPSRLHKLSKLLTTHVRFEERDLLPLVEQLLPDDVLTELATSGRRDV